VIDPEMTIKGGLLAAFYSPGRLESRLPDIMLQHIGDIY